MINSIKQTLTNLTSNINKKKSIPGNWHVQFIIDLARIIKPTIYVELGLYQCELFNQVIPYAQKLIGVDMAEESGKYMKKNKKTQFHNLSTDEFCRLAHIEKIEIDMLFIDANHSYESVKKDFLGYMPLVKDGGIVLLHDGYPKDISFTNEGYCGDGYKAIDELTRLADGFEMMTIPIHPGLTLARKRSKHLPWL